MQLLQRIVYFFKLRNVSFEGKEPEDVIYREDLEGSKLLKLIEEAKDGFLTFTREFYGDIPYKVIIWPNSKKEGYVERYEYIFPNE